jgi:hypothetical protein
VRIGAYGGSEQLSGVIVVTASFAKPYETLSRLCRRSFSSMTTPAGRRTVAHKLQASGYEVQVAPDAEEALTLFRL